MDRTLAAEAAKNDLEIADDPVIEPGPVEQPRKPDRADILDRAALFAEEMMMRVEIRIVSDRSGCDHHFLHEAGPDQRVQVVVHRGAGRSRIARVDGPPDLLCGRMVVAVQQIVEQGIPLRREAKRGASERFANLPG